MSRGKEREHTRKCYRPIGGWAMRVSQQDIVPGISAEQVDQANRSWDSLESHAIPGVVLYGLSIVRLKLAFCTTCAVRVLVLAQGPSFLRLRRALLG